MLYGPLVLLLTVKNGRGATGIFSWLLFLDLKRFYIWIDSHYKINSPLSCSEGSVFRKFLILGMISQFSSAQFDDQTIRPKYSETNSRNYLNNLLRKSKIFQTNVVRIVTAASTRNVWIATYPNQAAKPENIASVNLVTTTLSVQVSFPRYHYIIAVWANG